MTVTPPQDFIGVLMAAIGRPGEKAEAVTLRAAVNDVVTVTVQTTEYVTDEQGGRFVDVLKRYGLTEIPPEHPDAS